MRKIDFTYVDEFDNETRLQKTINDAEIKLTSEFEALFNKCKDFMIACGFSQDAVNAIQITEEE